jgi:signal transduction histidine kinase
MTNALYYLEMVLEDAPAEVGEYLGILRHEIGLSEKIVGDLLDFARVKPPQRQDVDLAALVDEQLHRLGPQPAVRVERQLEAGLPPAHADAVQVGQIVFNLLVNATQAMGSAGGDLTVTGRTDGDGRVELAVHDAGPGVPEALRGFIFEPLFTTKARGIGLGLAVSRRLAETNGGELLLAETGPGATFVLRLPASRRRPA